MLFSKLTLLGLAALATAAPHAQPDSVHAERGLVWKPRSLEAINILAGNRNNNGNRNKNNNNNNNNKNIIDTTIVALSEQSREQELDLVILIQENIRRSGQKRRAKDNVRANHYRNRNRNVNTIVVVVTEIIDIRISNNRNTRYMTHQVYANNRARDDIVIMVTEIVAITIDSNSRNGNNQNRDLQTQNCNPNFATATGISAAPAIQTVDPNAPFQSSNATMLLPSGIPAPNMQNIELDPGRIVEEDITGLIVEQISGSSEPSK